MDAAFGNEVTGWTVGDWKTGTRPHGREAAAAEGLRALLANRDAGTHTSSMAGSNRIVG